MKFIATALLVATSLGAASADSHSAGCQLALENLEGGANYLFTASTAWELDASSAVSYPCSTGYLKNFAANENLQSDIFAAIDATLGAGCAAVCNVNNKFVPIPVGSAVGTGDLADVLPSEVCDALNTDQGVLLGFAPNPNGGDACICDPPGYVNGCKYCSGQVYFKVTNCLNIDGVVVESSSSGD